MLKTVHRRTILSLIGRILLMAAVVSALTVLWADREQSALADSMIRLHVLANSDSDADQALKLKVRDKILATAETALDGTSNVDQAERKLDALLPELEQAAAETIAAEGYSYPVHVELEKTWFPTREYATFSLPAGEYEALRVVIGAGEGHNWWCVVFPPLCVESSTETVETTAAEDGLSNGQIALVQEEGQSYVFKFRTIELWEEFKHAVAGG